MEPNMSEMRGPGRGAPVTRDWLGRGRGRAGFSTAVGHPCCWDQQGAGNPA